DDSQSNMTASTIHAFFFDRMIATKTGELVASWGLKTPFEARFWGDVRLHTSTRERFRGTEMRYFFSRNEMFTSMPVTLWKDDMVITGRELRYNTQTKEGSLARDVLIRVWEAASATASMTARAAETPFPSTQTATSAPPLQIPIQESVSAISTATPPASLVPPAQAPAVLRRPAKSTRAITPELIASAPLSEIAAPGADKQ
ncbi:MAG TPA: hypothetical protein PKM25_05935, partial [Candidatus Ozemobacteraceae bacterium]|nr:hypothetical protein [Candidatus Ozemobacteraceae bacterium]